MISLLQGSTRINAQPIFQAIQHSSLLRETTTSLTLLVVTAIAGVLRNPVWGTNDTGLVAALANGQYTGFPESELIISDRGFGAVTQGLYSIAPNIDWFSLLIATSTGIGLAILASYPFRKSSVFWVLLPVSVLVQAALTLRIDVTTSAILLAALSVLVSALAVRDRKYFLFAVMILLLVIASQLRINGALLGVAIALPSLLALTIHTKRSLGLAVAGVVLAVPFISSQISASCFARENCDKWTVFETWYQDRGSLSGSPSLIYLETAEVTDDFGEETPELFRQWLLFDDLPELAIMASKVHETREPLLSLKGGGLWAHFTYAFASEKTELLIWQSALVATAFLGALLLVGRLSPTALVLTIGWPALLLLAVSTIRSTTAISIGVSCAIAISIITVVSNSSPNTRHGRERKTSSSQLLSSGRSALVALLTISIGASLLFSQVSLFDVNGDREGRAAGLKELRINIEQQGIDRGFIQPIYSDALWCQPFDTTCSDLPLLSPGQDAGSPAYTLRKQNLGITESLASLIQSTDGTEFGSLLVANDEGARAVADYINMRSNHGPVFGVEVSALSSFPSIKVWAFCRESQPCIPLRSGQ